MRSTSLENIKALKTATGCTVNDIVMAICAGALREYLLHHDALPDKPLRAMVPVSIRTGEEEDPWTNRVSSIIAELPTNCADPLERVMRCHEAMNAAKRQMDLIPATAVTDISQFTSPVVATSAMRLVTRFGLANRGVTMPANVVISNVPGPRQPLYFAGARMDHYIPVSTIAEGMGLNITVHSYLDRLDFGLIADRELVPDLWDMADMHIDEIGRLFDATGATWAEPQAGPSMRRGGGGVKPVARRPAKKAAVKRAPAKTAGEEGPGQEEPRRRRPRRRRPRRRRPGEEDGREEDRSEEEPGEEDGGEEDRSEKESGEEDGDQEGPGGPVVEIPDRVGGPSSAGSARTARLAAMDFDLPPDDHPDRLAVRNWLAANAEPTGKQLADAGYVVPHWPAPWGLGADPIQQLIIDDELGKAGVHRPSNPIGIGWAAPTIFLAGTAGATRTVPAEDLQRRGGVVPTLLRTRCRLRSRQPFLQGNQGW